MEVAGLEFILTLASVVNNWMSAELVLKLMDFLFQLSGFRYLFSGYSWFQIDPIITEDLDPLLSANHLYINGIHSALYRFIICRTIIQISIIVVYKSAVG